MPDIYAAVVDKSRAKQMKLKDAIKVAADFTLGNGVEASFYYDMDSERPLTAIRAGTSRATSVRGEDLEHDQEILQAFKKRRLGEFHTHPTTDPCIPSHQDFIAPVFEHTLACPRLNVIARFDGAQSLGGRAREEFLKLMQLWKAVETPDNVRKMQGRMGEIAKRLNARHDQLDKYLREPSYGDIMAEWRAKQGKQ